jgi:hypothetical protein
MQITVKLFATFREGRFKVESWNVKAPYSVGKLIAALQLPVEKLGGFLVEELARVGIGRLLIIDPDVFTENNLNCQILATIDSLGRPKVEVAAARAAQINPAVTVTPVEAFLTEENGEQLLGGLP